MGGEVYGNIDKSAYHLVQNITPVPGGTGPLEMAVLAERVVAKELNIEISPWKLEKVSYLSRDEVKRLMPDDKFNWETKDRQVLRKTGIKELAENLLNKEEVKAVAPKNNLNIEIKDGEAIVRNLFTKEVIYKHKEKLPSDTPSVNIYAQYSAEKGEYNIILKTDNQHALYQNLTKVNEVKTLPNQNLSSFTYWSNSIDETLIDRAKVRANTQLGESLENRIAKALEDKAVKDLAISGSISVRLSSGNLDVYSNVNGESKPQLRLDSNFAKNHPDVTVNIQSKGEKVAHDPTFKTSKQVDSFELSLKKETKARLITAELGDKLNHQDNLGFYEKQEKDIVRNFQRLPSHKETSFADYRNNYLKMVNKKRGNYVSRFDREIWEKQALQKCFKKEVIPFAEDKKSKVLPVEDLRSRAYWSSSTDKILTDRANTRANISPDKSLENEISKLLEYKEIREMAMRGSISVRLSSGNLYVYSNRDKKSTREFSIKPHFSKLHPDVTVNIKFVEEKISTVGTTRALKQEQLFELSLKRETKARLIAAELGDSHRDNLGFYQKQENAIKIEFGKYNEGGHSKTEFADFRRNYLIDVNRDAKTYLEEFNDKNAIHPELQKCFNRPANDKDLQPKTISDAIKKIWETGKATLDSLTQVKGKNSRKGYSVANPVPTANAPPEKIILPKEAEKYYREGVIVTGQNKDVKVEFSSDTHRVSPEYRHPEIKNKERINKDNQNRDYDRER